jgi:hypothetical protein
MRGDALTRRRNRYIVKVPIDPSEAVCMSSVMKTASELKHLIQLRMNALDEIAEDDEQVFARDVDWQEPDESGCNWDMIGYRGPAGSATAVRKLVNTLRREYRLSAGGPNERAW